jgi:fructokinase
MLRLGIDLGGTKIEIIALADDGRELLRQRVATPKGDYMATVMAVAGLVEAAEVSSDSAARSASAFPVPSRWPRG